MEPMLPFNEAFADELEKLGGPLSAMSPQAKSVVGWGAGLSAMNVLFGDDLAGAVGGGFGGAAGWEAARGAMPGRGLRPSIVRILGGALGAELGRSLLSKEASRLRKAITFSKKVLKGEKAYGREAVQWDVMLAGKKVGEVVTSGNRVMTSELNRNVRGMGLGKKVYGELARRMPGGKLRSDSMVSDKAARVWEGMKGRKGYKMKKTLAGRLATRSGGSRYAPGPIYETRITRKARKPEKLPPLSIMDSIRDQFQVARMAAMAKAGK
jgi:hypothetical protein